ncbi:Pectinesterase A precursor [Vibrio aerogenes CECT 7868]|uniref:Pectinesterase A n=1 Tax=Vibrio aerogenes CECT 7868 TaxID=1216006 RepID=A0A1M5ZTL7_9VIBR|nr:pectinesterase family protein [Vibrio aerogenes]SHI27476.1 Pectinesterase A precursor [Vibrio aerogenes CECT 7868]
MKIKQRTVRVMILASFAAPMAFASPVIYAGSLSNQLSPAPHSTHVYEDTTFTLTFDSTPAKGSGSIRIYNADNDQLVDTINVGTDTDNIGYKNVRTLKTYSVRVRGRQVHITPHAKKLQRGQSYYVTVPASAFTGAKIAGQTFNGIDRNTDWVVSTRASLPDVNKTTIVVDDNGSQADFRTVQGAINFVRQYHSNNQMEILVKAGTYEEPLYIYKQNNLTIRGEGKNNTIITYKNNNNLNSGTSGRALLLAYGCDMLRLKDLTIKNSTLVAEGGQAETIYFNSSNGRLIAMNSNFISEQDTLLLKGWTWFYNTMVAGNVDFIWGYPHVSLFENSEIRTVGDSRGKNHGGYILQARVPDKSDKGFVFLNSKLTRGKSVNGYSVPDNKTYLARSGGKSSYYDNVAFINTRMDKHINTAGWNGSRTPNPSQADKHAGWREYNSQDLSGNRLNVSSRLSNAYQMTSNDVNNGYKNRQQIFEDYNNGSGWNPQN